MFNTFRFVRKTSQSRNCAQNSVKFNRNCTRWASLPKCNRPTDSWPCPELPLSAPSRDGIVPASIATAVVRPGHRTEPVAGRRCGRSFGRKESTCRGRAACGPDWRHWRSLMERMSRWAVSWQSGERHPPEDQLVFGVIQLLQQVQEVGQRVGLVPGQQSHQDHGVRRSNRPTSPKSRNSDKYANPPLHILMFSPVTSSSDWLLYSLGLFGFLWKRFPRFWPWRSEFFLLFFTLASHELIHLHCGQAVKFTVNFHRF